MAYRSGERCFEDLEAGRLRANGDGYAAAGELVTLVVSPDVQRFLGMSDDEITGVSNVERHYREALRRIYSDGEWRPPQVDPATLPARQEADREVERLLGDERTARLRRLSWRVRGGDALLDPYVADTLHLTEEQRRRAATVAEENERDHARLLAEVSAAHGRGAQRMSDSSGLEDRVVGADQAGSARLLALLTPEQHEQFARLKTGRG
jgi:hypothetical protein